MKCTIQTSKGLVQNSAFRRFVMMQEVLQCSSSQLDNLMSATTKILHTHFRMIPYTLSSGKLSSTDSTANMCTKHPYAP